MSVVQCEQVTKIYEMGKTILRALRGVSLTVEPGEFMCLAGPSGSGKTTLLNLIGCLDKPTSGQIAVEKKPTEKLSAFDLAQLRRRRIGFIFQTFNLIPVLTAYENVEMPLILKNIDSVEREKKVLQILEAMGIRELNKHRPDELSGGQQQRVAIARALVTEPAIVLADEPTANLDSETGLAIIELMHTLNRERGTTFVFSSHDPKVIERSSRVVRLQDGLIVDDGQ
jgi:putative ABC transport system ATP-binding protein